MGKQTAGTEKDVAFEKKKDVVKMPLGVQVRRSP